MPRSGRLLSAQRPSGALGPAGGARDDDREALSVKSGKGFAGLFRKKESRISCRMQTVMWFSGLRGAVSFALAMTLDDTRNLMMPKGVASVITTFLDEATAQPHEQNGLRFPFRPASNLYVRCKSGAAHAGGHMSGVLT